MAGRLFGLRVPVLRGALARPDAVITPALAWTTPKWFDRCLVGFVAMAVAAVTVPMIWGWYPTLGASMQPTLPYLGGYIGCVPLTNPVAELKPGDIVRLRGGSLGYAVKRVAQIDPQRGVYVLGDNTDRSADSSYGAVENDPNRRVWVPFSEIQGRATAIWSPKRLVRSWSAEGRWLNALEWSVLPRNLKPSPNGHYLVVQRKDHVELLQRGSLQPLFTRAGVWHRWVDDGSFRLITPELSIELVRVNGSTVSLEQPPTQIGFARNEPGEFSFDGAARVRVGDTIALPGHHYVGKVTGVSRHSCGNTEGLTTMVKVERPLDHYPLFGDSVQINP